MSGMDEKDLLLSICIPTYNRADVLRRTMESFLSLDAFDSEVELIISDNASQDNTEEVVREVINKYKKKRVIYHRNITNIRDLNFYMSLSCGSGKYVKLFNDYTSLDNETLLLIKKYINESDNKNENLFFYDTIRLRGIKNGDTLNVNCVDEFQNIVNNKITWISHFGCWKDDLPDIEQFNHNSSSQLLQMEWTLHLVDIRKTTKIVNLSYKCFSIALGKRIPYNFFIPHVVNYYKILEDYKNQGKIQRQTILFDKKQVLSDFVGNKIVEYLILRKNNDFDLDSSWNIIFKHFYNIPYFYLLLFKGMLRKLKMIICK